MKKAEDQIDSLVSSMKFQREGSSSIPFSVQPGHLQLVSRAVRDLGHASLVPSSWGGGGGGGGNKEPGRETEGHPGQENNNNNNNKFQANQRA